MSEYGEPWRAGENGFVTIRKDIPDQRTLQARILACVNLLAGVPTEILDKILLASSRNAQNSPASEIREHVLRWHELNGRFWDGNEQDLKDNEQDLKDNPPRWNGSEWIGPNGRIFPQPPAPDKTPLAHPAEPSTIEE